MPDRLRQVAQAPAGGADGGERRTPAARRARPTRRGGSASASGTRCWASSSPPWTSRPPHRNRFAYKLEGFDPEWVPLSGRPSVTYTNLNPGHYTFRLRAANSDGQWNEEGLAVARGRGRRPLGHPLGLRRLRRCFSPAACSGWCASSSGSSTARPSTPGCSSSACRSGPGSCRERQLELERVNEELAQASITDSLTGLANRRFLTEYVEKEVALLHRRYHRLARRAADRRTCSTSPS